jgi:hypothetical protein
LILFFWGIIFDNIFDDNWWVENELELLIVWYYYLFY